MLHLFSQFLVFFRERYLFGDLFDDNVLIDLKELVYLLLKELFNRKLIALQIFLYLSFHFLVYLS